MDFVDLAPKKRKFEQTVNEETVNNSNCSSIMKRRDLNGQTSVSMTNIFSGIFLTCFLDRLKLKTVPHISPLLDRLSDAENKNVTALKSIDKINKRIKELEFYVEKGIKTGTTSQKAVGTDLMDSHSEEYKLIINALQTSPFAPFKPPTSQAFRQNDSQTKHPTTLRPICPQRNGNSVDLINDINKLNGINKQTNLILKTNPVKLDILSAQFLPVSNVTNLMSNPRLTWDLAADGICLQWNVQFIDPNVSPLKYEISSFQKSEISINNFPWRKIGEVAALPLPMACTLTYVAKMNTYFFAIRAWVKEDVASAWSNVIMVEIN